MEIHQKTSVPNNQRLKTMVKRCIRQKLRLLNFDARPGRNESGAVVKNRNGNIGVEGEKSICYRWKEKRPAFPRRPLHFSPRYPRSCAKKTEHTTATPSEPTLSRGRSVSRKRSIRGKSNHGSILRQLCRYYLKGTCTRTLCEYWHPPECQFCKTETGCKSGDTCLFPHCKADEQPKAEERLLPKKKRKWRQRRCGCCEKRITIGLCIKRLGFTRFSGNQRVSVKLDAESLERNSKSSIHQVHATSREYPGQERTIAWKNTSQNHHQRSPYATKFQDRSKEETERQERCAQSKVWDLSKQIKTSSKRTTRLHSSRLQKSGFSCLSKSQRYGYGEWERLTLLSWRPWGHREVRRRWWRPTARCKQEKNPRNMSKNWTFSWRLCFLKKLPQFFLWRNSVRIMGIHTTGKAVKIHLIKNGKRIDCNRSNNVPFVVPGISASSSSTTPSSASSPSSSQESISANRDQRTEKSFGETWCRGVQILPVRFINLEWSREHTWNRVRVSTVYLRTFRRIRSVKNAWRRKKQVLLAGDVLVQSCPEWNIFGDLITTDHKILSEESESRNNHRYVVVVQDSILLVQNKNYPRDPRRTWSEQGNQKSFTQTIPWNLASLARNYPGIIVRQRHTDRKQMDLQKEQRAEWKRGHLRYC